MYDVCMWSFDGVKRIHYFGGERVRMQKVEVKVKEFRMVK